VSPGQVGEGGGRGELGSRGESRMADVRRGQVETVTTTNQFQFKKVVRVPGRSLVISYLITQQPSLR